MVSSCMSMTDDQIRYTIGEDGVIVDVEPVQYVHCQLHK
jgi:hypothetical protein